MRSAGVRCGHEDRLESIGLDRAGPLTTLPRHAGFKRQRLRRALSRFPLDDPGALQYRRRHLRPLGGARARPARHPARAWRRAQRDHQLRRTCARPPTGSPMCCARRASSAATASRSSCRRRRKWRPRTSRSTSSARWRCRSPFCSGRTRCNYRLQNSGAKALLTNAQGLGKIRRDPRAGAARHLRDLRRRWRWRRSLGEMARAPISRRSTPPPTIRR